MESDYDFYEIGCKERGIKPLNAWRFRILYSQYQREYYTAFADLPTLEPAERDRAAARLEPLHSVAEMVRLGRYLTSLASSYGDEDGGPGMAACSIHQPRSPHDPLLVGHAAQSLPAADAPDLAFWRV